jgi:acetyl-CoA C-acetyltransferase
MDASRVPVLVGWGQAIERDALVSATDLAERAVRTALEGAGSLHAKVSRITAVAALFSPAGARPASELADRLGLTGVVCETTSAGGHTPQWLVNRAADDIAAGRLDCTIIAGAEAVRSHRARSTGDDRLFQRHVAAEGEQADPMVGGTSDAYVTQEEIAAGLVMPTTTYAMFESLRAAAAGRSFAEQRAYLGPMMARYSEVAATNPYAWFPLPATAEELATPSDRNRLVSEPYTKRMNAFPTVDQGAALVACSLEVARSLGLDERAVFILSGADAHEVMLPSARPDLTRSAGMKAATARAFEAAGLGADDIGRFDFYTCFPVAAETAADAVGIGIDDARGLTVTGGLPYFGGPGNNYSTHGIATMAGLLREQGGTGMTVGIGGFISKQSVGIYGSEPSQNGFSRGDTEPDQTRIDATALDVVGEAEGEATVVANTVTYGRSGEVIAAPIIATLDDGRRVAASADPGLLAELAGQLLVGRRVRVSGGPPVWRLSGGCW